MLKYNVYAMSWNEMAIMPAFFKHYSSANKITIIDNCSDDGTKEYVESKGGVYIKFDTGGRFCDEMHNEFKDNIWKNDSDVDYVIVQDLDEFLFFPEFPNDLISGLKKMKELGVTIVKSYGYNMYNMKLTELFSDRYITTQITNGNKNPYPLAYDKCLCFSPTEIKEIRYTLGAHQINPSGNVKIDTGSSLLLHYKYVDKVYITNRCIECKTRLIKNNPNKDYGLQYNKEEKVIREFMDDIYQKYSSSCLFRIMYPDPRINKLIYGEKRCLIFSEEVNIEVNQEHEKMKGVVCVNYGDLKMLCLAFLNKCKKVIYVENEMKEVITKTVKLNGWTNFEMVKVFQA